MVNNLNNIYSQFNMPKIPNVNLEQKGVQTLKQSQNTAANKIKSNNKIILASTTGLGTLAGIGLSKIGLNINIDAYKEVIAKNKNELEKNFFSMPNIKQLIEKIETAQKTIDDKNLEIEEIKKLAANSKFEEVKLAAPKNIKDCQNSISATQKYIDGLKKIYDNAYNECINKNITSMIDDANSALKGYRIKFSAICAAIGLVAGGAIIAIRNVLNKDKNS